MQTRPRTFAYRTIKRAIDILGSLMGLCLLAPLIVTLATAIRISTGGPAFFGQVRTGRDGRPFRVFKLRSMTGPPSFEVGRETSADDPRITPIGAWLRRTGCDELPQLVNVLRGEMSLVGPRPLLAWENELCDDRQARRLLVRPGITGLAQVNGRNSIAWEDRIAWDIRYVDGASLGVDLVILLRTLPVALFGLDAYSSSRRPALSTRPEGRRERWRIEGDA
jgi:lipopolysaccharide/colanic/teichoic acid biosynthesis glycosyltransferase